MAGVAGFGIAGYWSQDGCDEEQQVVYVPGLHSEDNMRSAPKSKTSKSEGRKTDAQKPHPAAKIDFLQNHQEHQVSPDDGGIKSASLKDLCPEDKRRIANLIQELARVSEEKEVTEERLKMEQESFEKKIRQLEEQNNLIGTEREALQQQYRECQELLSLYQSYLAEQQKKLHASPRRIEEVREVNNQPTAAELNGSYLGSDTSSSRSYGTNQMCRNDPACRISFRCDPCECCSGKRFHRKHSGSSGLHVPSPVRASDSRHCAKLPDHSLAQSCLHSSSLNAHSTPGRHPTEQIQMRPKKSSVKSVSEERKHQLLLQKLELEMEKERLQQLLSQQETKLLLKQQQLQQSRLEHNSRSQILPDQPPLIIHDPRPSSDPIPMANSFRYSPARPLSEGVTTPPSIKSSIKHLSGGKKVQKTMTSPCETQQRDPSCAEEMIGFSRGSTKDAATSPYPVTQKPVSTVSPPVQREICRYETSLIDMLDAISPISSDRPRPHCRDTNKFRVMSPAPRIHSRPAPEDPEESKMLEEIFFIC
ncbi:protein hinderin [Xenopus laevis]|uniref:Protein hinderin n=1 Tax=Xenopus laevis TaxID=8355 RepID=A0A8J1M4I7_XENLA|nr:protein hinderin [Xenopus laevis]